jgi:putative nucleotidyltransferase with HDIG domain
MSKKRRPSLTTPFERLRNVLLRQAARPFEALTPQTRFIILFVFYVLITTFLLLNTLFTRSATEFYREGDVAHRTIIAPADFVTEHKEETDRRRQTAREAVPPVFTHDPSSQNLAVQNFRAAWDDLKKKVDSGEKEAMLPGEGGEQAARVIIARNFNVNDLERLANLLRTESESYIYDDNQAYFNNQVTLVNYQNPSAKTSVEASSLKSLSKAKESLSQNISFQLSGWSASQKTDTTPFLLSFLEPNITYNYAATQSARDAAVTQIPPVMVTLKRGQAIVREGDKITSQMVSEFAALRNYERTKRPYHHLFGLLFMVTALYWIAWKFIQHRSKTVSLILSERHAFALVGSAIIIQTIFMRAGFVIADLTASKGMQQPLNDPTVWSFLIPFASAALLVSLLVDTSLALLTGIFISLFAGLLAPNGMLMSFYSIVASSVAVYGIGRYRERQSVTIAGLLVGIVNAFMAVALLAYAQQPLTLRTILVALLFGVIGGLMTSVFTAGGLPINESVFGILTDVKLLELSNADLPVLGQLAMHAPGTNQHSHAVGQLAEEACRAINGNVLLVRIGSLYHDIGKLGAPEYFIENQHGYNPHDKLKPLNSAKIITSHVNYGLKLAKEIGLPKRIADFIPQHHGTRTLHYFLRKAQAMSNGVEIDENDFRYPGPKPQFKEAAIMMLADSCEAAARSLAHPDPENIRVIVEKIFEAILSDNQLDECDITLRELNLIRESMISSLVAIYHARIDYPGFNPPSISGDNIKALPRPELDSEERGISYNKPSEVPISKGGEVEDEALTHGVGKC